MNPKEHDQAARRFLTFGYLTVGLIFLVIIAGGVVRATGSGMGCPDWPRCFGLIIPPTDVSQLPADYKERYRPVSGHDIETFNVFKTWTEYINRLIGALAGLFVVVCVVLAWRVRRLGSNKPFIWMVVALLLMGLQGWLGKLVVDYNLKPVMVTIHMALALIIVGVMLFGVHAAKPLLKTPVNQLINKHASPRDKILMRLTFLAIILTVVQVLLGTKVREGVDVVAATLGEGQRGSWIEALPWPFLVHRSFSILIVIVIAALVMRTLRYRHTHSWLFWLVGGVGLLTGIEILAGIGLAYLAVPAPLQTVHLVAGALLCGTLMEIAFYQLSL